MPVFFRHRMTDRGVPVLPRGTVRGTRYVRLFPVPFPAVFRWKFFRADGFAAILPDGFFRKKYKYG